MILDPIEFQRAGDAPAPIPAFDASAMGLRMMRELSASGRDVRMPMDPSLNVHFATQFQGPCDIGDAVRGRGGELPALLRSRTLDAERADALRRARRDGFLPPVWSPDAVLLDAEAFGLPDYQPDPR